MQTLALENYGTVEMNLDEQKTVEGGIGPWAVYWAAVAVVATTEIIQDWDGLKAGIFGKPEPAK